MITKASLRWQFDTTAHRYRDGQNGRFLPERTILDLRDGLLAARKEATTRLAEALSDGRVDLSTWQLGMRAVARDTALTEYIFGRGGINAMMPADYGRVGAMVKEQYQFLNGFAAEIAAGQQSAAQIQARAAMYAHAGVTAHSAGKEASYGGALRLPAHPGQGTACLANCLCAWSITEGPEAWVCTWVRHGAQSCGVCRDRAAQYAPLVVPKIQLRVVA